MCQQIYFGIGEGYQTVCSYNYGAGRYRRVKAGFWFCIKLGGALLLVILVAFLFPEQIISLFREDDPAVIEYGSWILRAQMATLSLPAGMLYGIRYAPGDRTKPGCSYCGQRTAGAFSGAADPDPPKILGVGGADRRSALFRCVVHDSGNSHSAAQSKKTGNGQNLKPGS